MTKHHLSKKVKKTNRNRKVHRKVNRKSKRTKKKQIGGEKECMILKLTNGRTINVWVNNGVPMRRNIDGKVLKLDENINDYLRCNTKKTFKQSNSIDLNKDIKNPNLLFCSNNNIKDNLQIINKDTNNDDEKKILLNCSKKNKLNKYDNNTNSYVRVSYKDGKIVPYEEEFEGFGDEINGTEFSGFGSN
jgi:hypothetical protein